MCRQYRCRCRACHVVVEWSWSTYSMYMYVGILQAWTGAAGAGSGRSRRDHGRGGALPPAMGGPKKHVCMEASMVQSIRAGKHPGRRGSHVTLQLNLLEIASRACRADRSIISSRRDQGLRFGPSVARSKKKTQKLLSCQKQTKIHATWGGESPKQGHNPPPTLRLALGANDWQQRKVGAATHSSIVVIGVACLGFLGRKLNSPAAKNEHIIQPPLIHLARTKLATSLPSWTGIQKQRHRRQEGYFIILSSLLLSKRIFCRLS